MNPTGPEILYGVAVALSTPSSPETEGLFSAGRASVIGLLSVLAAQEMERGVKTRAQENAAMRDLFAAAAGEGWSPRLTSRLESLAAGADSDLALSALDASNAELRRLLIDLHEQVELDPTPAARGRELRIARLLRAGAEARRLELHPSSPG